MNRVLVLMYHQVDLPLTAQEARFCTPPNSFSEQVRWLKYNHYNGVSLDEVVEHVRGLRILPERCVHITFDDGFVGVLEHALPVLRHYGYPASLYTVAKRIGKTNDWMSSRGYPRRALLSVEQLHILSQEGFTLGSHTCSHARLSDMAPDEARSEIQISKSILEDLLGRPIRHFAYPYGAFNAVVRDMVVEAGYNSACSTRSGFNRPGEDPFLIRRIDIYGTDRLWQFKQKITYGMNDASWHYPLNYYTRRLRQSIGK